MTILNDLVRPLFIALLSGVCISYANNKLTHLYPDVSTLVKYFKYVVFFLVKYVYVVYTIYLDIVSTVPLSKNFVIYFTLKVAFLTLYITIDIAYHTFKRSAKYSDLQREVLESKIINGVQLLTLKSKVDKIADNLASN